MITNRNYFQKHRKVVLLPLDAFALEMLLRIFAIVHYGPIMPNLSFIYVHPSARIFVVYNHWRDLNEIWKYSSLNSRHHGTLRLAASYPKTPTQSLVCILPFIAQSSQLRFLPLLFLHSNFLLVKMMFGFE